MGFGGLAVTIPLGLSAGGADRNTHLPVFLQKKPMYILQKLLPEDQAFN